MARFSTQETDRELPTWIAAPPDPETVRHCALKSDVSSEQTSAQLALDHGPLEILVLLGFAYVPPIASRDESLSSREYRGSIAQGGNKASSAFVLNPGRQ
jgi:hypothetical protein